MCIKSPPWMQHVLNEDRMKLNLMNLPQFNVPKIRQVMYLPKESLDQLWSELSSGAVTRFTVEASTDKDVQYLRHMTSPLEISRRSGRIEMRDLSTGEVWLWSDAILTNGEPMGFAFTDEFFASTQQNTTDEERTIVMNQAIDKLQELIDRANADESPIEPIGEHNVHSKTMTGMFPGVYTMLTDKSKE